MKSPSLMKLLVISIAILASQPLWAEAETETGKRACQVLFPNKPADAPEQGFLFDGTGSREIALSGRSFSSVVDLPSGPVTLYFSLNPVTEVEELGKEAPSVQLSEEVTDFYLLVRSTPGDEATRYSLEVVDIGHGKLKAGETLWMNFTEHNLSAKMGDASFIIPPQGRVVSQAPLKDNGYYPVKFTFQQKGEGEYRDVLNKTWRFQKDCKSLGFIIETGGRRPNIFTIIDRR